MAESNGRVYDPAIARFLSPDPLLQDPNNALNYNRYTYCMNNPLVYSDPTGESFLGDVWRVATGATVWDYSWTQLNNFAQWADETDWFPSSGGFSMSFDMPYNYAVNSPEPLSNDDPGFMMNIIYSLMILILDYLPLN